MWSDFSACSQSPDRRSVGPIALTPGVSPLLRRFLKAPNAAPPNTSIIVDGSGTVCTVTKPLTGTGGPPAAGVSVAVKPTRFCGLNDVRSVLISRTCDVSMLLPTAIPGEKSKLTPLDVKNRPLNSVK